MSHRLCMLFVVLWLAKEPKAQILQNKTIRFVLDLTPRGHICYSEFNRVNWLPVRFRVQQIVSTDMHGLPHGNVPLYLREDISMIQERHFYMTSEIVFFIWFCPGSTVRETNLYHTLLYIRTGTSYQSPFELLKPLYIFVH